MKTLITILLIFYYSSIQAITYYVSTTGNNNNSGTVTSPFLTIQKSVNVAVAGDIVIVENGTYNWTNTGAFMAYITANGTSGNPITFRARNRGMAILNGNSNAGLASFRITGSYISISGFEITGFLNTGMEITSAASNINISDLNIHDIGRQCSTEGDGTAITSNANNLVIERCLFHDSGAYAPGVNGCSYTSGYTGWQTLYHGVYCTGTNITIKNNVFYNVTGGFGVQVYAGSGNPTTNLSIINNTFENGNQYQAAGHIIIWNQLTTALIANNIFKDHGYYAINIYQGSYNLSGIVITKNIVYGGNNQVNTGATSGVTVTNNYTSYAPLFVNEGAHDYSLQSVSPAINRGYDTGLTTDYDNNTRSTIDIGAFEYQASTPTQGNYYVSTAGNNNNSGSFASPFLTFAKAASVAVAGDTVYFRGGTYTAPGYVSPCNNGTAGNPIVYSAYNNEVATFNFAASSPYNYGMYFYQNNYISLNKLKFVKTSGTVTSALRFYNCSNIEINSCDISGGSYCVRIENSRTDTRKSNFRILNSYIHHPDQNGCVFISNKISDVLIDNCELAYAPITGGIGYDGVYISGSGGDPSEWNWTDSQIYDVSPQNITVKNSRLHDNGRQGILCIGGCDFNFENNDVYNNGATGIQIENNAINGIVQKNHCYDNSHLFPVECGIWINNCKDIIVRQNLCERNIVNIKSTTKSGYSRGTTGIDIYYNVTKDGYSATTEYNVASLILVDTQGTCSNNTFIRSGHAPISGGQANSDNITIDNSSVTFSNNIIYNSESLQDIYVNRSLPTTVIDYNLYYNSTRAFKARVTSYTAVYTLAQYQTLTGFDTHSIILDPLFVGSADFQLQSTSSAINAGAQVGLLTDYSGHSIVGMPDMGAYEYTSGQSPQVYWSTAQSGTATRNNCGIGYTGSTVTYTVVSNAYSSTASQTAADNLAISDVTANKQAYANSAGTCTSVYTGSGHGTIVNRNNIPLVRNNKAVTK